MEYIKGTNGFTLEFNEEEESHFERFVNELKSHDEFSDLTSESEFLALILNEGVASLQFKISRLGEDKGSDGLVFPEFLATMLNESLSALRQYKPVAQANENGYAVSLDDILSLMPDLGQLFNDPDQLLDEKRPLALLDEDLTVDTDAGEPPKQNG